MQIDERWYHQNGLLARLSADVCARLRPDLQLVQLPRGMVLYGPDADPRHVYFPRSGVVSLLHALNNGDGGEVAIVGNEGIVGVSLMVDSQSTPTRAVVQSPGEAWAMRASLLTHEFQQGGEFALQVLRYTQALIAQMAQVTLCTRRHRVEQQVCRWLLFAFDRSGSDELLVTHEAIAGALGVRREGITESFGRLQQQAGISCSRGRIRLLDRAALEQCTCECYFVVRKEYQRFLSTEPRETAPGPAPAGVVYG